MMAVLNSLGFITVMVSSWPLAEVFFDDGEAAAAHAAMMRSLNPGHVYVVQECQEWCHAGAGHGRAVIRGSAGLLCSRCWSATYGLRFRKKERA